MHYSRQRTRGDVGGPEPERAPRGGGSILPTGYRKRGERGRNFLEHREVMSFVLGRPLERHEEVHHRNGDRLDNRPENLELWVVRQPVGARIEDIVDWLVRDYYEYFDR
jgi:hypothetical protein